MRGLSFDASRRARALTLRPARDLDVHARVLAVPASACVRGIFFNLIDEDLRRRGLARGSGMLLPEKRAEKRRSYALYPLREFLPCLAAAGARADEDASEGVRAILSGGAPFCANTWFGRVFQRFLHPSPTAAFHWLERSRDYMCNYGHWRVEERGRERVIVHMFDEYIWIDPAHRGGCEGLLVACGVTGEVNVELDGAFRGRLDVRWERQS